MAKDSAPSSTEKALQALQNLAAEKRRESAAKLRADEPVAVELPGPAERGPSSIDPQLLRQIGGVAAIVLLLGAMVWWWNKGQANRASQSPDSAPGAAGSTASVPKSATGSGAGNGGPTVVGSVEELSKPWATKTFTFVKPYTLERVKAMAVRLPSGELWAFALQSPYGHCELEFVADLNRLTSQFGYEASHPMIVSPCDNTVYDPLKAGPIGGTTWARGEIVKGTALRPPLSINVEVNGNSVIADRME